MPVPKQQTTRRRGLRRNESWSWPPGGGRPRRPPLRRPAQEEAGTWTPRSWSASRSRQPVPAEGHAPLLRLHQAGRALRRAAAARGLPAALGYGLPGRPLPRRARTPRRAARHLPRDGAPAHRGRRLPRQQGPHHHSIEDELGKREARLKLDSFYDVGKARRVETILREMLAAKGRPFATVSHAAKPIGPPACRCRSSIDDGADGGARDRVRGQPVFSDATLRGAMKAMKQTGLLEPELALGQDHLHARQVGRPA